jgi:ankyrin repeat protein
MASDAMTSTPRITLGLNLTVTALSHAAKNNDLQRVWNLLQSNIDVDSRVDQQRTVLHLAAMQGTEPLALMMMDRKANVNLEDYNGKTPLHYACANALPSMALLLISRRANVNALDDQGATALFSVTQGDGSDRVLHVLLHNNASVNVRNHVGRSALHVAANTGNLSLAQALLDAKASVNCTDNTNSTPLHCVAEARVGNQLGIVQLLLQSKAQIDARTDSGQTALCYAVQHRTRDEQPLTRLLLRHRASGGIVTNDGKTVMHYAIKNSSVSLQLLVDRRAPIDAADHSGRTPLHYMIGSYWCSDTHLEYLLAHRASVNSRDHLLQDSVVHSALRGYSNSEAIARLIECRASINAVNASGDSPLHVACSRKSSSVLFLIDQGADAYVVNVRYAPTHFVMQHDAVGNQQRGSGG